MKINLALLVAIAAEKAKAAALAEGPRIAAYAMPEYGPEVIKAPPQQSRGVWQCYGPEEE